MSPQASHQIDAIKYFAGARFQTLYSHAWSEGQLLSLRLLPEHMAD